MEQQFKKLVEEAQKIIITSHISPDADAVSSSLLLARTLKSNFQQKEIRLVLEERPAVNISFLDDYKLIEFASPNDVLSALKPDLLVITDANNFNRVSRNRGDELRQLIKDNSVKTTVIDHHEETGRDDVSLFFNQHGPAAVQEVYRLCFDQLGLNRPDHYADTVMLGLISDTGRFKYFNALYEETFRIVPRLIQDGANIELLEDKIQRYSVPELNAISELVTNLAFSDDYSYSFISDDFSSEWLKSNGNLADFKSGCAIFVDQFIRNINDRWWGFIIYPDLTTPGTYAVSFRAVNGVRDVSQIAGALGGGGHKPAAGAKFSARSASSALGQVVQAIEATK